MAVRFSEEGRTVLSNLSAVLDDRILVVDGDGSLVWADSAARDVFELGEGPDSTAWEIPAIVPVDGGASTLEERPDRAVRERDEPVSDAPCRIPATDDPVRYSVDATPIDLADDESYVALVVDEPDGEATNGAESDDGERERQRVRQQEAIADLGEVALRCSALDDLFERTISVVANVLDAERCLLLDLSDDGEILRPRARTGWADDEPDAAVMDSALGSLGAYTAHSTGPLVVDDFDASPRFDDEGLSQADPGSGIGVSVGLSDDSWGVLCVQRSTRRDHDRTTVAFLEGVANLLASAIERHDRQRTLETTTDVFRRMTEISVRDAPFEERVGEMLALGRDYLDLDAGFQTRMADGTQTIELLRGTADDIAEGEACPVEESYCKRVLETEGTVATADVTEAGWADDPAYERWGFDAYIGHTVAVEDHTYGTVGFVASDARADAFDDAERAFVGQLANWIRYELTRQEHTRQLEASHQRYRTLVENVPNGAVALFDADLRYDVVGGTTPLGAPSPTELEGEHVPEVLSDDAAETIVPHYRATVEGERRTFTVKFENEIRRIKTVPVRDDGGDVDAGIAISQDVTAREKRERRLRRQRGQLDVLHEVNSLIQDLSATVLQQSDPADIWAVVETRISESDSYDAAWTWTVSEDHDAVVRPIQSDDGTAPFDPPVALDSDSQVAHTTREGRFLLTHDDDDDGGEGERDEDAPRADEATATVPIATEDEIYGSLTLRTSRENAFAGDERAAVDRLGTVVAHALRSVRQEAKLRQSEQHYQTLAENIPNSTVALLDDDLRCHVAAGEGFEALATTPDDFRDERPTAVDPFPDPLGERLEALASDALNCEQVCDQVEHDDHTYEIHVLPIHDHDHDHEGESAAGAMALVQDVTERVERRRRVEHEHERLEFLVRLLRHNLLNSLNVVDARLNYIEGKVPDDARPHLETAQHRTDEMIDVVDTIRALTNTAVDGDTSQLEPVPLHVVVRDRVESTRRTYPEAEIELASSPDVHVLSDDLLSEAIENLLLNAVQHNDKETPVVTVDTAVDDETVTVSIADNGPGISEDLKGRLVAADTRCMSDPSIGFGLQIVREIIDTYDGDIAIDDNDPEGTVFRLTLPRATDEMST